jgi:hypothetical protein
MTAFNIRGCAISQSSGVIVSSCGGWPNKVEHGLRSLIFAKEATERTNLFGLARSAIPLQKDDPNGTIAPESNDADGSGSSQLSKISTNEEALEMDKWESKSRMETRTNTVKQSHG